MKPLIAFILTIGLAYTPVFAYEPDKGTTKEADKPESAITVPLPANQPTQKLADIKKIFVTSFGAGEGAELIRNKVINRLIKSGVVSIVNSQNNADATLTGAAEVSHRYSFYMNPACGMLSGGTRYHAQSAVRLIGKNDETLWSAEKSSRLSLVGSVSSTVASRIANSLLAAIAKDKVQIVAKEEAHL